MSELGQSNSGENNEGNREKLNKQLKMIVLWNNIILAPEIITVQA